MTQQFRAHPDYLAQLLGKMTNQTVVITVDQFEELFTLCTNEADRQAFVNNLLSLTQVKDRVHFVLLTMRVDFEQFVQLMPELQQLFVAGRIPVLPLNAAEMREAIELPAKQVGLKFETGVIDRLLSDILGEAAGLPLLQFTLLRLWEERKRNRVTQEIYEHVGGGRLALARTADAFYDELLPEDQVTVRRLLLRMVRPGSGTEVTSSRILRTTVFTRSDDPSRVERVLHKLIAARLVRLTGGETPDDDQIEVAHEALVRNWPRLVEWTEQERDALRQRLRLRESARQWDVSGRDTTLLWRGTILDDTTRYDDLDRIERAFVRAGIAAEFQLTLEKERAEKEREVARAEREAARERELDQMRALAEEQRLRSIAVQELATAEGERAEEQSRRLDVEQRRAEEQTRSAGRLRWLSLGLFVALLVAVGVALFAGAQQVLLGQAQQKAAVAIASNNEAQAQRAEAVTQAGIAQATGFAVSASAVQASTAAARAAALQATAEDQAKTANTALAIGTSHFAEIQTQASYLQVTSTAIQATANSVQTTAAQAGLDAQAAVATANSERANAQQAQTDAANAKTEAADSKTQAANAQIAAVTAQASANFANATAKAAQGKADTIAAGADARLKDINDKLATAGPALTIIALSATPTPTPTRTPTRTPTP